MSVRAFASVHSGLLARKGEAEPSPSPLPQPVPGAGAASRLTPSVPHQARPQNGSGREPGGQAERVEAADAAPQSGRPLRASVRLDPERARRLRLAALLLGQSHQQLLRAALDNHLDALGRGALRHCSCFNTMSGLRPGPKENE